MGQPLICLHRHHLCSSQWPRFAFIQSKGFWKRNLSKVIPLLKNCILLKTSPEGVMGLACDQWVYCSDRSCRVQHWESYRIITSRKTKHQKCTKCVLTISLKNIIMTSFQIFKLLQLVHARVHSFPLTSYAFLELGNTSISVFAWHMFTQPICATKTLKIK